MAYSSQGSHNDQLDFCNLLVDGSTTISKGHLRCKLEIDGRMAEQVMELNYLGVNITSSGNPVRGIKTQPE